MPKIPAHFSILSVLLLTASHTKGQEPHYAGVQSMNIWYNPSLKIDKIVRAHIAVRSVKYPNIISYTCKTLSLEVPLVNKKETDYENSYFFSFALGICADNASENYMNASTAMLSLSYALPLSNGGTYLALGFQGNYSFNRVGNGYSTSLPDQFDKTGAVYAARIKDPFESGYSRGYFTPSAGISAFHSGQQEQWYVGVSVRNFTHPYTEWNYSVRLPSNFGIQGGYTFPISNSTEISSYANFSWQNNMNEHVIGARYDRHFGDSTDNALSLGVGYRFGNALVPQAGIQIGRSKLLFYYELVVSKFPSANYHRKAYEISFTQDF
jgi:hypothetical protein